MVQRDVARFGLLIDQHRMALREGAAFAVLARKANREAIVQEGGEGERFGSGPVDRVAAFDRSATVVEEAENRLVDVEPFRHGGDPLPGLPPPSAFDPGLAAASVVGVL